MLRQAVRTVLAHAGDRTPSPDAWGLVLVAAGVEPTKAAGLPARLGCVFHLGRWREQDVVVQLQAWGDALRVRAEPEVAAVVDRAAAALAAEISAPRCPTRSPAAAAPVPTPAPHAAPPPPPPQQVPPPSVPGARRPAVRLAPRPAAGVPAPGRAVAAAPPAREQRAQQQRPQRQQPPQQQRPQQQGHQQQGHQQQGHQQQGHQQQGHPAGPPAPQRPQSQQRARPQGKAPRSNRWVAFAGIAVLVLICGCGVFGVVADLFGGNG